MTKPEKYTEAFFKFLGWNWREGKVKDSRIIEEPGWYAADRLKLKTKRLPPLHLEFEGLGLQEKWLWPELEKRDVSRVVFIKDGLLWHCLLYKEDRTALFVWIFAGEGVGETKALAQLIAGCKALGLKNPKNEEREELT